MYTSKRVVETFPSARIAPRNPASVQVEVSLIATLGPGSGNHLFANVVARQKAHESFVDALDEPSAKLGGTDFSRGDATSLYSFVVGPKGHPFHRHAGHRVFTAISGSGGAQLRFSTATPAEIAADAQHFIDALHFINIPPDSLFTVRFGGDTWHQFAPMPGSGRHPVFFALSCHTNELGGALSAELRQQVLANAAHIALLTELLPPPVQALLDAPQFDPTAVATTALALDAPPGSWHSALCDLARSAVGRLRGAWGRWRNARGFSAWSGSRHAVTELATAPAGSLLLGQLGDKAVHHEDTFRLTLRGPQFSQRGAQGLLAQVLEGFLESPPHGVGQLMALRNLMVRPLGLRTSRLGCPVSSLLSDQRDNLFAQRFPVLAQQLEPDDQRAQVVLGANDKHVLFRSCVGVQIVSSNQIDITLGTRVHCRNAFGRFYMAVIDQTHRSYVTPTMLRHAVDHACGAPQAAGMHLPVEVAEVAEAVVTA